MDYGRPALSDCLAAHYVAGTLRGRARARFEALLPAHPALRSAVSEWRDRLMPLTVSIAPKAPPPRVWQRIESALDAMGGTARPTPDVWWRRLGFWRGLTALGAVGVISLSVLLATPGPATPPIVVVLNAAAPSPTGATPASFVAGISGDGRTMVTRPISNVSLESGRSLELWAIQGTQAPRSLGVISAQAPTVVRRDRVLRGADTLAVSLEPTGGSPSGAPTGPVLFVGKL